MEEIPTENEMQSKSAATSKGQRDGENLDVRYGKIGISAVAAALPYQSDAKNSAYAPVVPREDHRHLETAAG
jgi:hypothetical protein